MILYHFATSPYARRVRLALAHKGLSAELRDARAQPEYARELPAINPLRMVPVLVDGARTIVDSTAICHYLERKVPDPPLFPPGLEGAAAFEIAALADGATTLIIDLGMRYHALHDHPGFPSVREQLLGRAQGALNALADRVRASVSTYLCGDSWSFADMAVYTTVAWLEGLPARAAAFAAAKQMLELGWTLPQELGAWAALHRTRADVSALG